MRLNWWKRGYEDDGGRIDLSTNVCYDCCLPDWKLNFKKYSDEAICYEILSDYYNVDVRNIVIGLGLSELITRILSYVREKNLTLTIKGEPTWKPVQSISRVLGITEGDDVVYYANPNGNTGVYTNSIPRGKELTILDLSYDDFSTHPSTLDVEPGVIKLKTLSKSISLPGVRFGWAIGDSNIIKFIQDVRPAHVTICDIENHLLAMLNNINQHVDRMNECKRYLENIFECKPSQGNYVIFTPEVDLYNLPSKVKYKRLSDNYIRMALTNKNLIEQWI